MAFRHAISQSAFGVGAECDWVCESKASSWLAPLLTESECGNGATFSTRKYTFVPLPVLLLLLLTAVPSEYIQAYYIYPQSTQIFELFQYRSGGEATSMACIEFAFYSLHLIGPHIRPFIVLFQLSSHRNWHYAPPTWWHENYVGQCAADRNVDGFKEWVGEEMLSKRLPKTQAPTHSALALLFLKDNN